MNSHVAMQITDEDRGDVRAGTWGAVAVGGAIVVGLLLHAQIVFALVAGAVLLVTIAICRVVLVGVMYPVASTAARIVARAAGDAPFEAGRGSHASPAKPSDAVPAARPAYSVRTSCGCGAAIEVTALVAADTQRAMLTPFFEVHEPCVARALAGEPDATPMTSTVTCCCGEQLTVDLVSTQREEMAQRADAFIAVHRGCAS